MEDFEKIKPLLRQVADDRTVPRNIRDKCEESIKILEEKGESEIKISNVISILDEISSDPNIPMYTRTQIWNIVSALEGLNDQK